MKYILNIIILLISYNIAWGQEIINFKAAVEKALLNNYSIRIAKESNKIADNNVSPGNAGMLPKIDIVGGYNYTNQDIYIVMMTGQRIEQAGNIAKSVNAAVQLSWTLLDDMGMFISYERLKSLKSKSDIELKISVENTVKDISNTFLNALLLKRNLEVLQESIELSRHRLKRIEDRLDYGVSNSVEILKARVDLNTDSANFMRTELNYRNSLRMLKFLMGVSSDMQITPDTNINFINFKSLEEYRNSARKSNASILQAVKNKEITELEHELLQTNYMPKLNFTASYSYQRSDADAGFLLINQNIGLATGLNLSWNIFDGLKTNIQSQNNKISSEINSITIEMLRSQIDMAVINNYEAFSEKKKILDMDIANLEAAESNYRKSKDLYESGQISSVELREAQLNLSRAKMRINESLIDAKHSETELNILSGTLSY
ncbi:MAG: TolC family protein [Candidatus Kapaibacterium sp.]